MEMIFYGLNKALCTTVLGASDLGGSMYIHVFGCYFGIASTLFFNAKNAIIDPEKRCVPGYMSSTVALVGTIFLYLYFPSFNAALAPLAT